MYPPSLKFKFEVEYYYFSQSNITSSSFDRSYRRANSLSLFQKIIFDVFMSFIDPR